MDCIDWDLAEELAPNVEVDLGWQPADVLAAGMEFMSEPEIRTLAADADKIEEILYEFYECMMGIDWREIMQECIKHHTEETDHEVSI